MNKRHLKRHVMGSIVVALTLFALVGTANALVFKEVFLGGKGDFNAFFMAERQLANDLGYGNRAEFQFDLTGWGGVGYLLSGNSIVEGPVEPTNDETEFDPTLYKSPFRAFIDFWFSELHYGRERIRIDIESNVGVLSRTLSLEDEQNQSRRFRINLDNKGLLDLVADGQVLAVAFAPRFGTNDNIFTLDRVQLTAEADLAPAPVPEPATIVLLGLGLLGLGAAQRRRART